MVPSGTTKQWEKSGCLVKGPEKKGSRFREKKTGSPPNTTHKSELQTD